MLDEKMIIEAAENTIRLISVYEGYDNAMIEAFTAGYKLASEQYQEEIKRLRDDMKTLWLNSRANYISKDQAELTKKLRIKYGLD